MKFVFIVNERAGGRHATDVLRQEIANSGVEFDYEIYVTKARLDATDYVKNYCKSYKDEACFVACGGDGTVKEVVSGLVGEQNKYFAVMPYGTGNDFIKYYPDRDFLDLKKLLCGKAQKIDVIKVNDTYCVNMINVGLEADVASYGNKVKEKGGKNAYLKGLIHAVLTSRYNKINVYADGEKVTKKRMLLCSIANGRYAGGKYMCAPKSLNNDGYIDLCVFHCMSLLKFLTYVKTYEKGKHLDNKRTLKKCAYRRVKTVRLTCEKGTEICLDGESLFGTSFEISVLHNALNFILPEV